MDKIDEKVINRVSELARKEVAFNECIKAMKLFCERVDKGEVRSVKTYNSFKNILNKFEMEFRK